MFRILAPMKKAGIRPFAAVPVVDSRLLLLGALALLLSSPAAGQAGISLLNANATLSQTSDTQWKLDKTGALNASNHTVTWSITATQGATIGGHLVVNGFVTVANSGSKGATIGNIVVNLQTKSGSNWTTRSSDVADATHGDAATSATRGLRPRGPAEGRPLRMRSARTPLSAPHFRLTRAARSRH